MNNAAYKVVDSSIKFFVMGNLHQGGLPISKGIYTYDEAQSLARSLKDDLCYVWVVAVVCGRKVLEFRRGKRVRKIANKNLTPDYPVWGGTFGDLHPEAGSKAPVQ